MLTETQIQENKELFIELIKSIEREGVDKEGLLTQLENSDFFDAPASTAYHNAFRGGLCEHSLNVYRVLDLLMKALYPDIVEDNNVVKTCPYTDDSIKIVTLLHDFDKMNKYERFFKNEKVYSETGTKYDDLGKFDWVSVPGYRKKKSQEIFSIGTHGENSVYMTETFIPLSTEEHCAILNHHSVYDNPNHDTTSIYNRYSLACLLHVADVISTYVLEKI